MKKVCICAHFGEGKELWNGQSVKAHTIASELEKNFGQDQVIRIDTHGGLLNIAKATMQLVKASIDCGNIIIMPGENGLRFFVPIIEILGLFIKRSKHYIVVGGWLHTYLQSHSFVKKCLYKWNYIYVETEKMKTDLVGEGYDNIVILHNCKDMVILPEEELTYNLTVPYKLCTFSRVLKEKGIEEAIHAVTKVNEKNEQIIYTLDIYGQLDVNYKERFDQLQRTFPDYIKYRGTIPAGTLTDVLSNYFLLLFPTYYEGEGFAGTLIDAYAAGVPVIASDWKYNKEFVDADVGYIVKAKDIGELSILLDQLKDDVSEVNGKKAACVRRALCYTNDAILSDLFNRLD